MPPATGSWERVSTADAAGPLAGLTVGRLDPGPPGEVAAWLLWSLGAQVREMHPALTRFVAGATAGSESECRALDVVLCGPGDELRGPGTRLSAAAVEMPTHGVPTGTLDYLLGVALATAALASWRSGHPIEVSELGVAVQLYLPHVMAASYGAPVAYAPSQPVAAPGGGWVCADLGSPDDRESFATLLGVTGAATDSVALAAAAQEWRLPVCAYRRWSPEPPRPPVTVTAVPAGPGADPAPGPVLPPAGRPPLDDVAVCDLTAMWAGPLATWLLSRLGATVHKVEPHARLDGTRAITGGGIYPGGRQVCPGEDSGLYNALNGTKDRLPLDLRDPVQLEQLVALAAWCDVVIDSYSPRVMPNFGLTGAWAGPPGRPLLASMPAFGPGAQRDWVAYGTGVHAHLGLGDRRDGTFAAPLVSYADPVAGFTGALAVVAGLVGRDRSRPVQAVEVPLASAAAPLLAYKPADDLDRAGYPPGELLFDAGLAAGAFVGRSVAGMRLLHPRGPFLPARS